MNPSRAALPELLTPPQDAGVAARARDLRRERDRFRAAVVAGLSATPKTLPCKYFYDAEGARLFERICGLDEYYPTRTELAIMRACAPAMAKRIGPRARVVELGSGEGLKTRILLGALERPAEYLPVDISAEQLAHVARTLRATFPGIRITPVVADYTHVVALPLPPSSAARTIVYFAGSTIGNFEPHEARAFLKGAAALAGPGGGLLLGVDLKKDRAVLEAAYNDREGVTAAFNLNLLKRINRELGGEFPEGGFEHRAIYDTVLGRIEMHLVSQRAQTVRVGDARFEFAAGERITTEYSYKYDVNGLAELAESAGFTRGARHDSREAGDVWVDPARQFSVHFFRVAGPSGAPADPPGSGA